MSRLVVIALLSLLPIAASAEAPGVNQKVAVLPLTANRVPEDAKKILDDLLVSEVARVTAYQVIGSNDINAMLGLEKMKQAVGCDDVSCAAEIGGALGVDHLLSGSVSRLGSQVILQLNLIDIRQRLVVKRGKGVVQNDEDAYAQGVTLAVDDLFKLGQAVSSAPPPGSAASAAAPAPMPSVGVNAPFRVETEDNGKYMVSVESRATGHVATCPGPVTPDKPCLLRDVVPGPAKIRVTGDVETTVEYDLPAAGKQAIVTLDDVPKALPAACIGSAVALPVGVVMLLTNIRRDDPDTSEIEPGGLAPAGILGAVLGGLGYIGTLSTCVVWGVWMDVSVRDVAIGKGDDSGGGLLRKVDIGITPTLGGAMLGASLALP